MESSAKNPKKKLKRKNVHILLCSHGNYENLRLENENKMFC